jgi:hypothetical protein
MQNSVHKHYDRGLEQMICHVGSQRGQYIDGQLRHMSMTFSAMHVAPQKHIYVQSNQILHLQLAVCHSRVGFLPQISSRSYTTARPQLPNVLPRISISTTQLHNLVLVRQDMHIELSRATRFDLVVQLLTTVNALLGTSGKHACR